MDFLKTLQKVNFALKQVWIEKQCLQSSKLIGFWRVEHLGTIQDVTF